MDTTLDYASRDSTTRRPLWRAIVIALVGCPVASIATAVLGCQQALGSGWLSPANFRYSVDWGLAVGVFGGLIVAGLARAFRSQPVAVSIVGSVIVSGVSGVWLFMYASMVASC
jgi:hypothetical protein